MFRITASALVMLSAPPALAFGSTAHEAICEIAFQEIGETARGRVIELIQRDHQFDTFRASCNFADRPRQRAIEHFVNLPRTADGLADEPCPLDDRCVVSAIEDDFTTLRSPAASADQKLGALKFLGHWVGDLHQPLHVSFEDDRGGNSIRAQGTTCDNLHAVWDRCIVEERIGTDPLRIADELRGAITDEQRAEWFASDAIAWANESFTITTAPEVGYCVQVEGMCRYAEENAELDAGEPEKSIAIDDAYLDGNAPVLGEQLAKAGVRLAGLIEQALGDSIGLESPLKADLLDRIEAIERQLAELRAVVEAIEE